MFIFDAPFSFCLFYSFVNPQLDAIALTQLDWVLDANPEVAAQCIVRSGATIPPELLKRCQDRWLPRLTDLISDPSPLARAAVGRALGLTDLDNRPGVSLRDGLPDIVWCDVPAGKATIGGDDGAYQSLPETIVSLPAFKMSKYPITYRQFQAFIDAPDGYQNAKWWDGLHEDGKTQQQEGAGDQVFKFWNHPRETVSWYEAMAFCAWLSVKLGQAVRLPTEQEWEYACRGTDGRFYAYGKERDTTRANTFDGDIKIGQTNTVGIFPHGASPYGIEEMIGNVWEWTLSNKEDFTSIDIGNNSARVLRGGSWSSNVSYARAASRYDFNPYNRGNYIGFRVVVVSAPIPTL